MKNARWVRLADDLTRGITNGDYPLDSYLPTEKQQRFYVYKSTYYYSKEHKRSREQRTQVGTIVTAYLLMPKATFSNNKSRI